MARKSQLPKPGENKEQVSETPETKTETGKPIQLTAPVDKIRVLTRIPDKK